MSFAARREPVRVRLVTWGKASGMAMAARWQLQALSRTAQDAFALPQRAPVYAEMTEGEILTYCGHTAGLCLPSTTLAWLSHVALLHASHDS